jgi:hypothetical protein
MREGEEAGEVTPTWPSVAAQGSREGGSYVLDNGVSQSRLPTILTMPFG